MRMTHTLPSVVATAALTLLVGTACQDSSTAPLLDASTIAASSSAGPVVLSATGSGHGVYTFEQGTGWRTFAFSARKYADGSVDGQVQVHNQVAENGLHGEIVCMGEVGDGILGIGARVTTYGTFTVANLPNLTADFAIFAVRDNGEGAGAAADQFTGVDITGVTPTGVNLALLACSNPAALGLTPEVVELFLLDLQHGNIQVRR